jgi:hypothetical protein
MQQLPWQSIAFYCVFGIFVHYQRMHVQGLPPQAGAQRLGQQASAFLGMLVGFAYLVLVGWKIVWWMPAIPLGMGVLAVIPAVLVERLVGREAMSRAAFFIWPICAWLMFYFLRA